MLALSVADIGTLGKLGHALGAVLVLLVVITVLTMLSGRLLGMRLRWWRALVAGFPGIVMGYTFSWAVNGYRRPPVFTPQRIWPVAVLGTMVVAVVMELLDRPGRLAGANQAAGRPADQVLIDRRVATIPGLDGRKMSKSHGNTLPIFAEVDELRALVARIVTDSRPPEAPKDPETCRLFAIYRHLAQPAAVAAMRAPYLEGGVAYRRGRPDPGIVGAATAFHAP